MFTLLFASKETLNDILFRFPYLLAGNSVVLKQESEYFEHFYSDLLPWLHYVPVNPDLSNLVVS